MPHRWPDAIEPGTLIAAARRRERRTRELFGIKPVSAALRRVAPDRQRAWQRFGLEAVAEAGHVARRGVLGIAANEVRRGVDIHVILLADWPTFPGRACRSRSRGRRSPRLHRT